MADKEEVGPTDESSATPSSDASAEQADLGRGPGDDVVAHAVGAGPADPHADDELAEYTKDTELTDGREPTADAELTDPTEPTDVTDPETDEFDEIVRDSGIGAGSDSDDDDDTRQGSDGELEPAGVAAVPAASTAGTAVANERSRERKAKEAATRRRDQPVQPERTGPVKFVRESIGELRKVVYPTGQQLMSYFVVVLVFVLFIIAYVGLLDLGLGWLLFRIFGGKA